MDSIRDFKEISFREIEQAAFRIACKTQIEAMRILLEDLDDEIHRNRDKKRYKSLGLRERTVDTILGIPLTFKRRYYKDVRQAIIDSFWMRFWTCLKGPNRAH
jgi:hypothetical protein